MNTWLQIVFGIVYANFVEYAYHRWIMHSRRPTYFSRRHSAHHWLVSTNATHVDAALSLTWPVMTMFVVHAIVLRALGLMSTLYAISGYLVALEITHRAQHRWPSIWLIGPWHASHHEWPRARFNTFCGIWDWILGTHK
ncbi:MAG: hypothetical protein DMG30_24510 [Acidobacteria bacterium]|nr:MAG: hypothetical protein DMG30_24510 [Acidobacteriota bacterium]